MEKIDFVVTYLDGDDLNWQEERATYTGDDISEVLNSESRYRNMDNFYFWFRAVEKYAPWVNKIHVVTWGHVPSWLNTDHPKINIVKHEDFIPKKYLPVFNSNSIEMNIDRIEGLAEHFVNFNDDLFLNNTVNPEDFFVKGMPVTQIMHTPIKPTESFFSVFFNNILAVNKSIHHKKLFNKKAFSLKNGLFAVLGNLAMLPILFYFRSFVGFREDHLCHPLTKNLFRETRALLPNEFEFVSKEKFRDSRSINVWFLLDYARAKGQFIPHNSFKFGRMSVMGKEVNYTELLHSKFKVLCFNDESVNHYMDFEVEKNRLNKALLEKYPDKSLFEL